MTAGVLPQSVGTRHFMLYRESQRYFSDRLLATVILSVFCIVWVWSQSRDEEERTEEPVRS